MNLLARFSVRFRYAIVLVWVVVGVLTVRGLPGLGSVANSDNSAFLPSTAPSQQAGQLAAPFQSHGGSTAILVAVANTGTLTPADEAAFTALESSIAQVAHVTTVRDQGISSDGAARRAAIALDIAPSSTQAQPLLTTLRSTVTSAALPSDMTVHVTGQFAANVDTQIADQQSSQLTTRLSNIVILVMLLLVYRAALAPLLNLAVPLVVLLISQHMLAQAATNNIGGLQISNVTQSILTILVLGAGTDYGLFLTLRVHEELKRGYSTHDAVIRAVSQVGESISFSAGTVIAALLCLLLASFGIYHDLGPSLAVGIVLMLLAGLTLLPALLAILGRATFWPRNMTVQAQTEERPGTWGRIAGTIVERPVATLLLGIALFGVLSVAALHYAPGGYAGSTMGPTGSDSANGTAAIQGHFPPTVANPTSVLLQFASPAWGQLTTVQRAGDQLSSATVFSAVSGPLNPNGKAISPTELATLYNRLGPPSQLPPVEPASLAPSLPAQTYNMYRAESQFISADGRTVQFYTTLAAGDPTSTAATQAIPQVRDVVTQTANSVGALASGVSGVAAVSYDVSSASDDDLLHIVPVVLLLIGILLALVMRSLVAPLYLVASVALSYSASLGVAVILFMGLKGDAGVTFVLPFLMFIFLMALGEDYNILVMSRIREEAEKRSLHDAIRQALNATGTTVTSAGLILAATFGVAGIVGSSDEIRELGIGIGIGVLLDTFLVRTLLVPSVVALLGRWNWWPSRLSRTAPPEVAAPPAPSVEPSLE